MIQYSETNAFVMPAALLGVLSATIVEFNKVSPDAAKLLLPYLGWTTFAAALTLDIWKRNPEVGSGSAPNCPAAARHHFPTSRPGRVTLHAPRLITQLDPCMPLSSAFTAWAYASVAINTCSLQNLACKTNLPVAAV